MSMLILQSDLKKKNIIEKVIQEKYGIKPEILNAVTRSGDVVKARFIAFYLMRHVFKLSYPLIGQLYDKDHTTVIYGIKKVENSDLKSEAENLVVHISTHSLSS